MKKGDSNRSGGDNKDKHEASPRDKDHTSHCPQSTIREIKMIARGPSTGGSFRSLKKSQ